LMLFIGGCANDNYEVVERNDVSFPNYEASGTHDGVSYVLLHDGHKIYADCDVSTVDRTDPNASCGFRPLRTYKCELQSDKLLTGDAKFPLSDLRCKDADGRNVYLYVHKEE
jgi:hypothetical protein